MVRRLFNTLNIIRYKILGGKCSPWCYKGAICWKCKKSKSHNDIFSCQCDDCPLNGFTF